jgi:hypothetical protein
VPCAWAGLPDFSKCNVPKTGENLPNDKKFIKWPENIQSGCKIFLMIRKYANIFHSKALQSILKRGFLVRKYFTIWQPCAWEATKMSPDSFHHHFSAQQVDQNIFSKNVIAANAINLSQFHKNTLHFKF